MAEPSADEFAKSPVRLSYKIIAYVAIWIAALLLTAPGLWPLAWMFPLGLVALSIVTRQTPAGGQCLLGATPSI
jgi:hypothetical protein